MSQDFKTVKILDPRLCVTDEVSYGVIKGGQNNTVSRYPAIAKSTSQLVFNVQVPSEQTLIDRRCLIRNQWRLTISTTALPVGQFLVNYGSLDALAPFPCMQSFSTVQSTINNNTVNCNMQDVINAILRSNDQRELMAYNGTTPTAFDTYQNYSDGTLANNNPLGSFSNVSDNDLVPRGAFNITIGANPVGTGAAQSVDVTFETAEPLLVSPWLFADPKSNAQAIYGVTNLNFTFNMGSMNRVWRTASNYPNYSVVLSEVVSSELIFTFLTPHASDLMAARNCVPFYELPRYITLRNIAAGAQSVITNTLQLNQVPDKLMIFVRPQFASQTNKTADFFLPITGIKVNWNNQSGLLSNATAYDLYRYSRKAGSNQTWQEFGGYAWKANPAGGSGSQVRTSGSMLMLNMAEDLQLTEDWYAPGSIGNFNLQIELQVDNNVGAADYELVLITVNSGVMVLERGSTSIFTAILGKQEVLDASNKEAYSGNDVKRMIGGGFLDTLKSLAGKVLPMALPLAKNVLGSFDNKYAKAGSAALGALGYGNSGAGMGRGQSGGGMGRGSSGGALQKRLC